MFGGGGGRGASELLARVGNAPSAAWELLARADARVGFSRLWPDSSDRVLMYHSVGGGFYGNISPARLRRDLRYVDEEYDIVGLPEAIDARGDGKKVALTFDDGFRDFYDHAVPVLRELDVPATVFVVTRSIADPEFSHDAGRDYEYMTRSQLCELADDDLVTIGNHTRTHPDLGTVDDPGRLEDEILGAKAELESEIGVTPTQFSYPHSGRNAGTVELVRESHEYAVDGVHRELFRRHWTDPHVFPRVDGAKPWHRVRWELRDLSTDLVGVEQRLRSLASRPRARRETRR